MVTIHSYELVHYSRIWCMNGRGVEVGGPWWVNNLHLVICGNGKFENHCFISISVQYLVQRNRKIVTF